MTHIGIIPGRFNPAHLGHIDLFKKALSQNKQGAYVVLIRGSETGENKIKNPLDPQTQEELILNSVDINVMENQTGSLVDIIYEILEPSKSLYLGDNQYVFTVYCGTDRYTDYKQQSENQEVIREEIIEPLEEQKIYIEMLKININLEQRDSGELDESKIDYSKEPDKQEIFTYSATALREAIISGNDKLSKRMMGLTDKNQNLYNKIKHWVSQGMKQKVTKERIEYFLERI